MTATFLAVVALLLLADGLAAGKTTRWTAEEANAWYASRAWPVGANFIPSTAVNEIEMFSASTFDAATIDRELGLAESLGFNTLRVFLHSVPFFEDGPDRFYATVEAFLKIAASHGQSALFVLLDSCWDPFPHAGKQREPIAWLHNNGWVQCPGYTVARNRSLWESHVGTYIKGVVSRFKDDSRVFGWDIFNEPDNGNYPSYQAYGNDVELTHDLLELAFKWAREGNPSQPLTSGIWHGDFEAPTDAVTKSQLANSDIISFHRYSNLAETKKAVDALRSHNRPIICSEYMARPAGSRFDPILGFFKNEKVGAFNWGFVFGKTFTIMPWDSWCVRYTGEPAEWFHDIFRPDGTPYNATETAYIKSITSAGRL